MRKVLYGENDEYFKNFIAHVKMIGSLITKIWLHSTLLKLPIWKLVNIFSKIVTHVWNYDNQIPINFQLYKLQNNVDFCFIQNLNVKELQNSKLSVLNLFFQD